MLVLKEQEINLSLIDLNLSNSHQLDGLQVVKECKRLEIFNIVLTSHDDSHIIEQCFSAGCSQYFSKENFEHQLEETLKQVFLTVDSQKLTSFFNKTYITQNEGLINQVTSFINTFRDDQNSTLITGATGVGKSYLVQSIHEKFSPQLPLVEKNLNEVSDQLIESELFGHVKGAFTGATSDKKGLLHKANNGILFLDEIGTLSLSLQKKLLKVLEEKRFSPVGSNKEVKVNFKLISATCDDLQQKVQDGSFRLDFYFRIAGFNLTIPSLKDRPHDIHALIQGIVDSSSKKLVFTKEAKKCLDTYSWPGNNRELSKVIKNLMTSHSGIVDKKHLPSCVQQNLSPFVLDEDNDLLTPRQKMLLKSEGLPKLIQAIEQEAYLNSRKLYGDKVNKIVDDLQISKSVYYRIVKENTPA